MFIQKYFSIIKLNQETYFVSTVPVYFDVPLILLTNFLVLAFGVIVMILPSMIIARIYPAKTLRLK
jgi:lipoprotein-releasing system permease protein